MGVDNAGYVCYFIICRAKYLWQKVKCRTDGFKILNIIDAWFKYEEAINWIDLIQGFDEPVAGTSLYTGKVDKFIDQINNCLLLSKELRH